MQFSVAWLFPLIVGLVTYFAVAFFSRGARATRRRKAMSLLSDESGYGILGKDYSVNKSLPI